MTLDQLTEFFMWMTIIDAGLFIITSLLTITLKKIVCRMHSQLFGVHADKVDVVLYSYLGMYRILLITLNIVPYIALLIIK